MKTYLIRSGLFFVMLPNLSFAIETGYFGDVGIGVSAGPSSVVAPSAGFVKSGGTINGGGTGSYGLNSRGSVGAYADLGYNFKPYFGLETNYTYWGAQSLSLFTGQVTTATGCMSGTLYSQSVGGSIVGYAPLDNEKINIFAKFGVAALFSTFTVNDPEGAVFFNPGSYFQSTTEPGLTYGAGVQYRYTPTISVQLAWNGISQFSSTPISNLYYNMASIGIRYTVPNKLPPIFQK